MDRSSCSCAVAHSSWDSLSAYWLGRPSVAALLHRPARPTGRRPASACRDVRLRWPLRRRCFDATRRSRGDRGEHGGTSRGPPGIARLGKRCGAHHPSLRCIVVRRGAGPRDLCLLPPLRAVRVAVEPPAPAAGQTPPPSNAARCRCERSSIPGCGPPAVFSTSPAGNESQLDAHRDCASHAPLTVDEEPHHLHTAHLLREPRRGDGTGRVVAAFASSSVCCRVPSTSSTTLMTSKRDRLHETKRRPACRGRDRPAPGYCGCPCARDHQPRVGRGAQLLPFALVARRLPGPSARLHVLS